MELNLQSSNDQVIMPGVKRFFFFKNVFNLIFLMNWNCGLKKNPSTPTQQWTLFQRHLDLFLRTKKACSGLLYVPQSMN